MKHFLIFAAFTASAAHAQSYVSAAGEVVRSGSGKRGRSRAGRRRSAKPFRPKSCSTSTATSFARTAGRILDDLAHRLAGTESVVATAYADRLGHATYNLGLSARRAYAVRDYLVEKGVPAAAIRIDVAGAAEGSATCDDLGEETGRNLKLVACLQPDRRVAIEARPPTARSQ